MNKSLLYVTVLILLFSFAGCSDKAPACTNISWGEVAATNEMEPVLMYSAGENCSNYGNYYDENLDSVIENIKKMKFVKFDECREYFDSGISNPEDFEIVECPDFLPETIEIDKMIGCEFETPPDSNTDCAYGTLLLNFDTENENYTKSKWLFRSVEILDFYKKSGNEEPLEVSFTNEDFILFGHFVSESDFWMIVSWTENNEEKKVSAFYNVETSD